MRHVALLLLGLLIGAFGTVALLNALRQSTAFPHGVMAVTGYHMGQLREASNAAAPCDLDASTQHVQALAVLAADIEPAFLPNGMQDPTFSQYARQHRELLAGTLAQLPAVDCATLALRVGDIGDSCKACHRDYK